MTTIDVTQPPLPDRDHGHDRRGRSGGGTPWAVLADTAAYPDWNPLIRRLDGRLVVGEGLEVDFQPDPAQSARTMRPSVVALEPGRRSAGSAALAVTGATPSRSSPTEGGSRLVQHEVLSGVLSSPFVRTAALAVDTPRAFVALNDALAARAAAGQRA